MSRGAGYPCFAVCSCGESSMSEEEPKPQTTNPLLAAYMGALSLASETLLAPLPPTDPAVLREITEAQLGRIHYAAIGRVAAAWASFEAYMDEVLWGFAGLDGEVGTCFTGQMTGARPRLDAFISLMRHLGAARKWNKPFEALSQDVSSLGEQRNRAVHDVWELSNPATPQRAEATARRKVRVLKVHVPTTELLELEKHIVNLAERFNKMAGAIWGELNPSPEISPSDTAL